MNNAFLFLETIIYFNQSSEKDLDIIKHIATIRMKSDYENKDGPVRITVTSNYKYSTLVIRCLLEIFLIQLIIMIRINKSPMDVINEIAYQTLKV